MTILWLRKLASSLPPSFHHRLRNLTFISQLCIHLLKSLNSQYS